MPGNTIHEQRRPTVFWIGSYSRSGSTWIRMFLYNLSAILSGTDGERNINTIHAFSPYDQNPIYYGKYLPWRDHRTVEKLVTVRQQAIEFIETELSSGTRQLAGNIFVATHWLCGKVGKYPTIPFRPSDRAIFLVRNPLDVAVSFAQYRHLQIDQVIEFMCRPDAVLSEGDRTAVLLGSWGQHTASWTGDRLAQAAGIFRYEDFLCNPTLWFGNLAAHILKDVSDLAGAMSQAVTHSSFERLRTQEEKSGFVHNWFGAGRFFRVAQSGQWRMALTDTQIRRIVDCHGEQMRRFGYLPLNTREARGNSAGKST